MSVASLGIPGPRAVLRRRAYEPRVATFLYFGLTLFLAVGAVNSQNNLLFFTFGVAVAGMIVSGLMSAALLGRLEVRRLPVAPVHVGDRVVLAYRLTNRSRRIPALALVLRESLGNRGAPRAIAAVPYVAPGATVRVLATADAHARGVWNLRGPTLSTGFPFGLLGKLLEFDQPDELVVAPRRIRLRRGLIKDVSRGARSVGRRRRQIAGDEDFVGLRDYRPGDPTRTIAWKPSTRHARLITRQSTQPPPRALRVIICPPPPPDAVALERVLAIAGAAVREAESLGLPIVLAGEWLGLDSAAGERRRIEAALARAEAPGTPPASVEATTNAIVIGPVSDAHTDLAADRISQIAAIDGDAPELGLGRRVSRRRGRLASVAHGAAVKLRRALNPGAER